LLAIVNSHNREEYSGAIRSTWLSSVPSALEYRFFRGSGAIREPLADEVFLGCRDDYEGLPNKVQEIVRWAYEHGYDYVLKCDDDVVLKPKEIMLSGFDRQQFTGCKEPACKPGEIQTPFGFCYWLSRECMELVVAAPLPTHGNDEAWVSTVLYTNNILLNNDPRYYLHRGDRPKPIVRPLRAPQRVRPDVTGGPPPDAFAFCVYLNWGGFHCTPTEENIQEFKRLFERYK
jgi:hypothetical protein